MAATSGVAHAAKVTFETDAGDYVTRDLADAEYSAVTFVGGESADTRLTNATGLSENIAHIVAELNVNAPDWDDIGSDYDADYKYWVETATASPMSLGSNEWDNLLVVPLTPIAASGNAAMPITTYVHAVCAAVEQDSTKTEAAKEMIEKTLWDSTLYQASLLHLATAKSSGVCTTGTSQTAATKANWDIGAALIIGDGYH